MSKPEPEQEQAEQEQAEQEQAEQEQPEPAAEAEPDPEPEDEAENPADLRFGGKIANAPVVTNTGGYELKTKLARPEAVGMAGQNSGGFENRVVQESGTH